MRKENNNIKYDEMKWSFYNKYFRRALLITMILFISLYIASREKSLEAAFILCIFLVCFFGLKTAILYLKKRYFLKNGTPCDGKILNRIIRSGRDEDFGEYSSREYQMKSFLIEYRDPFSGEYKKLVTGPITENCKNNAPSGKVKIYVLKNGIAWAESFHYTTVGRIERC